MDEMDRHDEGWLHRLIFLSDGVFAIAMTLIAIDIHPPQGWDGGLADFWRRMAHPLGAYAVCFAVISLYWSAHRRIFSHVRRVGRWLPTLNFLVLGLVALLPAGAQLITGRFPAGATLALYLGLLAAISAANALLWAYVALAADLVDPNVSRAYRWVLFASLLVGPPVGTGALFWSADTGTPWGVILAVLLIGVLARLRRRFAPASHAADH